MAMASGGLGNLAKLSAELRVEIFTYAVRADGLLRRTGYAEQRSDLLLPSCINHIADRIIRHDVTSLLRVSKQTYHESVNLLYKHNVFLLSRNDIKNFGNVNDFCQIEHIVLRREDSTELDSIGGPYELLHLAFSLPRKCRRLAARTSNGKLNLKEVVFPVSDIEPAMLESLLHSDAIEIGKWRLQLGQPFELILVHSDLREHWQWVQRSATDPDTKSVAQTHLRHLNLAQCYIRCVENDQVSIEQLRRKLLLLVALVIGDNNLDPFHTSFMADLSSKPGTSDTPELMKGGAKLYGGESFLHLGPQSETDALHFANRVLFGIQVLGEIAKTVRSEAA